MKYGILSDIHAHEHTEFAKLVFDPRLGVHLNSRLLDICDTLWNCFVKGHSLGVETWLILGDVFHTRGQVPTVVRNAVWNLLQTAQIEFNCRFIILVGNHDQVDKDGLIHSIFEWSEAHGDVVTVIDTPTVVDGIRFIPYIADTDKLLAALDNPIVRGKKGVKALCMHAGVDGAAVGTLEYRIKDPVTVADLKPELYDWVFLGHYHKPQQLDDNVLYVGSPCQLTRAEAGDTKRFLVYDSDSASVRSVKTKCKEFYTVSWPMPKNQKILPGYYDVIVEDDSDPDEIRGFFHAHGVTTVKIVVPPKGESTETRMEVSETTTDADLVGAYCESATGELDMDLVSLGLKYLNKVTTAQASNLRVKFLSVKVRNFLSLAKADLILNKPGSVIALLGENLDAEGFDSNGAGKSSLLPESLFWCLFGKTARGIPADGVVNNIKKRNCLVTLNLKIDRQLVTVTRTRKHKELGSSLILVIDGQDATMGTNAATQAKLDQMLGMDFTTFSSVVAFSPDTLRFVTGTDLEQKAVLDSILQTGRFGEACTLVKADLKEVQRKIADLSRETTVTMRDISATAMALQTTEVDLKDELHRMKSWQQEQDTAIQGLKDERKELEEVVTQKRALLEVTAPTEEPIDLTELRAEASSLLESVSGLRATIRTTQRMADSVQDELTKLSDQEGKPCPRCGQVVNNLSKTKASLSSKRRELQEELETLNKKLEKRTTQLDSAQAALTSAERHNADLLNKSNATKGVEIAISRALTGIQDIDERILQIEGAAYNTESISKFKARMVEYQKTLSALDKVKTKQEDSMRKLEATADALQFWVKGFGNQGLKNFLLDHTIPHLTHYAQKFASRLTGDTIQIQFSTVTDAGKDKFSVSAINQEGSDIYLGNSSGEKRRIDMAVMFALFMVANSRVKLNLMLLDEVFDCLDSAGTDTVVEILESMARERKLTIFVTSHTELADRLHESITVQKSGSLSRLLN